MNLPIIQKPKYLQPCNRCGQCCKEQLCHVAEIVFVGHEENAQCPALEIETSGEFSCGMIKRPDHYLQTNWSAEDRKAMTDYLVPTIKASLGIGHGCQMRDDHVATS